MAETVNLPRRGVMLVLSSPSGAGKSSITRALMQEECERLFLSISVTTRARRSSEVEGIHYYFIDGERFGRMRDGGELLEWAEVHGNLYATPRVAVEQALARGLDVLFDIDWQGTQQLAAAMRDDVVTIFILPPSMAELQARLERRAEDNAGAIAKRLGNAASEMSHWTEYDYIVVNDDLGRALGAVRAVLAAERVKRVRQTGMAEFVARLTASR